MPDEGISPEVRQFIRRFIHSVEQLEILLLMRSQPGREWTPKAVFDVVRSNESSVSARMSEFAKQGLIEVGTNGSSSYRYRPKSSELDRLAEETGKVYRLRRVLVIETIFQPDVDPAQSFADAFRFRKS